jgi:hypothetical protein
LQKHPHEKRTDISLHERSDVAGQMHQLPWELPALVWYDRNMEVDMIVGMFFMGAHDMSRCHRVSWKWDETMCFYSYIYGLGLFFIIL